MRRLAIVDERDRISRDLHDSVIQAIYAQTLALDDVPDLVERGPGEARRRVDEAIDALHAVIRDIRNFIFGLRPVLLESGGLADGLRAPRRPSCAATAASRSQVDVADDGLDRALPIETVAELLAITREALSNIARHAAATHACGHASTPIGERSASSLPTTADGFDADAGSRSAAITAWRTCGRAPRRSAARSTSSSSAGAGTRIIVTLPRDRAATRGDQPMT